MAIDSLAVAAEADVPLNGGVSARFVIFRDAIGGSSTAVIVGEPDLYASGTAAAAFGLPDRRRVRLAALRLRRPAAPLA